MRSIIRDRSRAGKAFSFFEQKIDALPDSYQLPTIIEDAEKYRNFPPGVSQYHGKFSSRIAPQLNEPINNLHPDSPYKQIGCMKSVQSCFTTGAENAIAFFIRYKLGSILFLTASKNLGRIRSSANIDVMIDNSELAHLVKPFSDRTKRKTSDTVYYKEFAGHIKLLITSYNSIGDLKSNTFTLIIGDELDEMAAELKDQGSTRKIIEGRTLGVRNYKLFYNSTPSRASTSQIYQVFLEGDQRLYFVPCPLCGEYQTLVLKSQDINYGLTFNREVDKVTKEKVLVHDSVRYICQYCKKEFHESKKQDMLNLGIWRPTVPQKDKEKISYAINSLYSPTMFLSWSRICQAFVDTKFGEDLLTFKDFTINYMGKPWKDSKKVLPWETLKSNAENYTYGEVPKGRIERIADDIDVYKGALLLFGAVDVQKTRLELHVVGFGYGNEVWSIDYVIFYGDTTNKDDASWQNLEDYIYNHTYEILGKKCLIAKIGIDCGYNPGNNPRLKDWTGKSVRVYDFVADHADRCIALMGTAADKATSLIKESRINSAGCSLTKRYDVYAGLIKEIVMSKLTTDAKTVHFPKHQIQQGKKTEIDDDHFKQMMSESYQEIQPNKYGWKQNYKRNEVWDTFIYCWAVASYYGIFTWSISQWNSYYQALQALNEQ